MNGQGEVRAFIALEPPLEVREHLAALVADLKKRTAGFRWAGGVSFHLTLRFLGNLPADLFARVAEAFSTEFAVGHPLELHCEAVGGFPDLLRPRVVWTGLGGDLKGLRALANAVDERLIEVGIPRDPRAFAAHITLGRAARGEKIRGLARIAEELAAWRSGSFTPPGVILYESRLEPGGARHLAAAEGKIQR